MTADRAEAGGGGVPEAAGRVSVLDEILAGVREDVARRLEAVPLEQVKELAAAAPPAIDA